jgi:hypothetical protein
MTTDTPMPRALRRLPLAVLALAAVTCSDDTGQPPGGRISGTVYMSEPVRGAAVDVVRFDGGQAGATICSTITDDAGAYACDLGKLYGDLIVVATGGTTTEGGAALTLPAGATLRAPALGVVVGEQHTTQVNPASDLILAVGLARTAASKDGGFAASVARAHALVREHLEVDPVAIAPAALDATTTLTEPVKLALFLRGLGTLAATIAAEQSLTAVALNSRTLHDRVIDDASSAEAQLDGVGKAGGNALTLGPSCTLPANCTTEGAPMCVALCWVETNTLRARVAAGALAFLRSPANHTGLTREDALPWATHLQNNTSELFGAAQSPEGLDSAAPVVTWTTPAADQVFGAGQAIAVDVTATDALGVESLTVVVDLPTPVAIADTDPAPDRFQGTLALTGLPEGPLPLLATAIDIDGNDTPSPRMVVVDQVAGGTVSGSAYKARLANAPVAIYTFVGGTRGAAPVGTGTTQADGSFTNVLIAENTSGPLLVEVGGGGTYGEDSQPATVVTLDVNDVLRTIIPAFTDGGATSGVVVSPATELAVAYFTWLNNAGAGGGDVAARWLTAHGALEAMLGIASITTVQPSDPAQIDTLTAADRYGLVLLGISRTAWAASTSGGGDAGAFGPTINAQKVTNLWSRDIRDGCLDGKAGTTPLSYGGVGTLTDEATRLQLAQAIVAYLGDGARNVTAFTTPAEVLPLLDTLAQGGGNAAPGSCTGAVAGHLFDDNGRSFDRDGPLVSFDGATPLAGAFVRGTIMVDATATDVGMLDPAPTLRIVAPAGTVDTDGDTNDRDIHATFDTAAAAPGGGPLTVVLDGFDHSGNHSDVAMSTRTFTVDNTPPVIAITAPAMDGQFLRPPVTVQYTITEANVMSTTALLNGTTSITPGFQVAMEGAHTVSVNVVDRAGNTASATRTFTIDNVAPVLSVTAPAVGSYVRGPVTLSWSVSDANPGTVATATLDGSAITSPHTFNGEGAHTLVVNATDAAGNVAATATRMFTIDNTPPVITVNGVADGVAYQAGVQIFYSATDANPGTTLGATANGMNHNSGQSLFTPAGYTLVVTATDAAGNAATASRRFLVDSTPPNLSIRSQAPTGMYVKTPLTLVVDGTDNLQVSGVAGLAGSLAAPVTLAVTALSNGAPTTPTGSEIVNGDGSRTRTATFAGVADGSLAATFSMTDRSGNTRTLPTVNVTVDNTAPTGLVVASTGFVPANGTFWTTQALPTLTGSVTEANPGAIVTLFNGVTAVGSGTVTGGQWSATFTAGVPVSTGFDITVRVTDAAGNFVDAPAQRIARDVTGPRITSIARAFYNEANDAVDYPPGGAGMRPLHTHSGATTLLGGNAGATPPATCPDVAKYAYLTAAAPQGDEGVANPLTFDWQIVDESAPTTLGGAGADGASFQWRVTHVSSGVATSLYPITGTGIAGTFDVHTNLRRDGAQPVPALGAIVGDVSQAREGRFNIELRAVDLLGNATTVYSCMNYQPIGAPVKVGTPTAAGGTGVDALTGYQLTSNSAISQLLNGTHPGAGVMTVPIMTPTSDPVVLTFAPSSSGRTYSESWSFVRAPSAAAQSANITCGNSITPITTGVCSRQLTGAPPTPTESHTSSPFSYTPQLAVRVWGPSGLLPASESVASGCMPAAGGECSRFRVDMPANAQFATYNVVVGLRELRDAQFGATMSGYAEGTTTYWSNVGTSGPEYRTLSYTGLPSLVPFATTGDGIDRACTVMTEAPLAGQPGEVSYTCTQTRRFQAIRYLASTRVDLLDVRIGATSLANTSTTFADGAFSAAAISSYFWNPSESLP